MGTKKRSKIKVIFLSITLFSIAIIIAAGVLLKISNKIIKEILEAKFGKLVSVEKVDIRWNQVDVFNISLKGPKQKDVVKIESISLKADFMSLFKQDYIISQLSVVNPYVLIERDKNGKIISPVLPEAPAPDKKGKQEKPEKPSPPLTVKKIEVTGGTIDYIDGNTGGQTAHIKLRDLSLTVNNIVLPFADTFSTYNVRASMPTKEVKGSIKSSGKINLKTNDLESKIDAQQIDIVQFKPYFQKKSTIDVTSGNLDLDMNAKIISGKIHAPGNTVLRNLEFKSESRIGKSVFDVPLSGMVSFLKNNKNEIPVNFIIEGDMNDPKFSISQDLVNKVVSGIGEKIGIPAKGVAGSVAEGIMKIGDSIKKRFKK